jgi:N-acetylneuraminic acid mutarotase
MVAFAIFGTLSAFISAGIGARAASPWSTVTTLPFARESFASALYGDKLYSVGGYNENGVSIDQGYRKTLEVYDISAGTWACSTDDPATSGCASKTLAPAPSGRWDAAATAGLDGRIYVVGGDDYTNPYLRTLEAYDPASNSWSTLASMPTGRSYLAAATGYDGKIYVMGGQSSVGLSAALEVYDPTSNSWSTKTSMPAQRYALAATADGTSHKIYVLGGTYTGAAGEGLSFFTYDIDSNSWSTGTPMTTERFGLGATVAGSHLYALGGLYSNSTASTGEAYDFSQDLWSQVAHMPGDDFRGWAFTASSGDVYFVTKSSRTTDTIYRLQTSDQTAPTTTATAKNADNTSYSLGSWTTQNVTVTLSGTDNNGGTGVANTYYQLDSGSVTQYTAPIGVTTEGSHALKYWSVDQVGNSEVPNSTTIKIDRTAPVTTAAVSNTDSSPYTMGDWTTKSVFWALSVDDSGGSGVASVFYSINGGAVHIFPAPVTFTSEGIYSLEFWSVDNAGNAETHQFGTIKIDKTAPHITSQIQDSDGNPISPNSALWFNQPVTIHLTCSDPNLADGNAGSGVDQCPSKTLSSDGANQSADFTESDNAGNQRDDTFEGINIDQTPPTITCDDADGLWHGADVSISCSAGDATSGLADDADASFTLSTSVVDGIETDDAQTGTHQVCDVAGSCATGGPVGGNKIDKKGPSITASALAGGSAFTSGSWTNQDVTVSFTCDDGGSGVQTCPDSVTKSTVGTGQSVSGTAYDKVGNSSSTSFTGINIERTAPTTNATAISSNGAYTFGDWTNQTVTITLSPSDTGGSGLAATYYTIDDGDQQTYSAPFDISSAGNHVVTFWSTDNAGNVEASQTVHVLIDLTAPTTSASATTADSSSYTFGDWTNQAVTVTLSASDDASGVSGTFYMIDGGGQQTYSTPFSVSTEGDHTVVFWSEDVGGNVETAQTVNVRIDLTDPTISGVPTTSPNANGWYDAPVTIHWSCGDALSGVASCPSDQTIDTESDNQTVSGTATDQAGNSATADSAPPVNIDMNAPVVTYSGNQGSYTVDQMVHITCSASDSLSGVASTTCQDISGPASSFGLGNNTFSASATDNAGNVGTGSVSFTVGVTTDSLCNLTTQLSSDARVARQLCSTLHYVELAEAMGSQQMKSSFINVFDLQVNMQRGRALSNDQADLLIELANSL